MTYHEQLLTVEWRKRRREIIERDGHRCTCCGRGVSLFVARFSEEKSLYIGFDYAAPPVAVNAAVSVKMYDLCAYKRARGIGQILVFKDFYGGESELSVALTDKGCPLLTYLSLKYLDRLYESSGSVKHLLSVNEYTFEDGTSWPVLAHRDACLDGLKLLQPYVTESQVDLHVHHKYYVRSSQAWEYPDDALITLCDDCHSSVHAQQQVPVYDDDWHLAAGCRSDVILCERCSGTGCIPKRYSYQAFMEKTLTPKFRFSKKCVKGSNEIDYFSSDTGTAAACVPKVVVSDTAGNPLAICSYEVSYMISQGIKVDKDKLAFVEREPSAGGRQYYDTELCIYRYQDPIAVL